MISRAFDSHGFLPSNNTKVGTPNSTSAATKPALTDTERLLIADGLSDLGFSARQIKLILAGPDVASVERIVGRKVAARSLPKVQATSVTDTNPESSTDSGTIPAGGGETPNDAEGSPSAPPASSDTSTPAKPQYPPRAATNQLGVTQPDIIIAVWQSFHGDISAMNNIINNFDKLTGGLQAYVAAAVESGKAYLSDLDQWMTSFNNQQVALANQRTQQTQNTINSVSAAGLVAAAAANAIPAVGQIVSAAIAIGVAVSKALLTAFPIPMRNAADQVRDAVEGIQIFMGFGPPPSDSPNPDYSYRAIKQSVVQDPVAFTLPMPPVKTTYRFGVPLAEFQKAAHKLGLYPGEGNALVSSTNGAQT